MLLKNKNITFKEGRSSINLNLGKCIKLVDDENVFQVIGIDYKQQKCWIRRWPLLASGSPVFEISFNQIACLLKI